ncbi:RpiB/LacA/LacB family sugar-phosphate isomerase [Streptomyces sp. NBC_00370]|uniref:RpiB/LacA/LacB family sugar-phosphate isomerase n=1 Tax=Streptomyces sp. NBC_00370 TaxID=2975728 RepID=UPI002E265F56
MERAEKTLIVGSDDVGDFFLDELLAHHLNARTSVLDVRNTVDRGLGYARVAAAVAQVVAEGRGWRGLLVCGTGIGVSIAANRVPGANAAICHDLYSVRRSILSNNCKIICFGSRVIAIEHAVLLLDEWLATEFDPKSRSALKVAEIDSP